MKIIIAGSRKITDKAKINLAIFNGIKKLVPFNEIPDIVIISGGARGVDLEGEAWARSFGYPIKRFNPDWDKYGKRAGYLRNVEMANNADALIALWDGESKGTKHMMDIAREKNLKIYTELIV